VKDTYSQALQDKDVIEYYREKIGGFFVDAGAFNGVRFSNTYLLEKKYGWKGVCIEPQHDVFNKLTEQRTAICENVVLYSEPKTVSFKRRKERGNGFAGIQQHLKRRTPQPKLNETLNLQTKTLTSILDEHNCPKFIDYLSLDTEGSEIEVLKGLDLHRYQVGYMTIEVNSSVDKPWEVLSHLEPYEFYLKKVSRGPKGKVLDAHFVRRTPML
jgi:FkbM family methyltransferase